MDWAHLSELIGVVGGMGFFFWKIIDKRFDKIDDRFEKIDKRFDKVDEELKDIRMEVRDVRERVSVLEAETIMYNIIPDENRRSEAAKRMWHKRRAKRLVKHQPQGE